MRISFFKNFSKSKLPRVYFLELLFLLVIFYSYIPTGLAYQRTFNSNFNWKYWDENNIPVGYILNLTIPGYTTSQQNVAAMNGADAWSNNTAAFDYQLYGPVPDTNYTSANSYNTVMSLSNEALYLTANGNGTYGCHGALGFNRTWSNSSGEIYDSVIVICENNRIWNSTSLFWVFTPFNWYAGTGTPASNEYDLWSTVAHEFGHMLGLDHSSENPAATNPELLYATMYYAASPGITYRRDLNSDDIAGEHAIYGSDVVFSPWCEALCSANNPCDIDCDALSEDEELSFLTLVNDPDTDNDGLEDGEEVYSSFTNPTIVDTDGDGLTDYEEFVEYGCNGTLIDTDWDALNDYVEETNGLDCNDPFDAWADYDGDGLTNSQEIAEGTLLNNADSDGDGMEDLVEINNGLNPMDAADAEADPDGDGLINIIEITVGSNINDTDTDNDGLNDYYEVQVSNTSPANADTDGDGLDDPTELNNYLNPNNSSDASADSDFDGLTNANEILVYGTIWYNPDTDSDGLIDGAEINIYNTSPTNPDTDGDGLNDNLEVGTFFNTNPNNPDTDGDGLTDGDEVFTYGCSPSDSDTDNDNLSDGYEVNVLGTSPVNADTDGDGLNDYHEVNTYNTSPTNPDSDGDGLNDGSEVNTYGTQPNDADTDNDGLNDGNEISQGTNPLQSDTDADGLNDGDEITQGTNPLDSDTDNDGLIDGDEVHSWNTSPLDNDSDNDGLSDGYEASYSSVMSPLNNDSAQDPDSDGLTNYQEYQEGTYPNNSDSDGDTLSDGDEVNEYATNPLNPDTDNDTLSDAEEVNEYETNPLSEDTDNDEWNDAQEVNAFFPKNPNLADNLIATHAIHDFAGNGYGDLIIFYSNGNFDVVGSNGTDFIDAGTWNSSSGSENTPPIVGDFNGDEKDDLGIVDFNLNAVEVFTSNGSELISQGYWTGTTNILNNYQAIDAGDFSGDGKDDLIIQTSNNAWYVGISTGSQFINPPLWLSSFGNNAYQVLVGDVDDDGDDDLVSYEQENGIWQVALSNGTSFNPPTTWLSGFGEMGHKAFIGDFSGDEFADLLVFYQEDGGYWEVAVSLGNSFQNWGIRGNASAGDSSQQAVGDFDGDCKADVVMYIPPATNPLFPDGNWEVLRSDGLFFDSLGLWDLLEASLPIAGGCNSSQQYIKPDNFSGIQYEKTPIFINGLLDDEDDDDDQKKNSLIDLSNVQIKQRPLDSSLLNLFN